MLNNLSRGYCTCKHRNFGTINFVKETLLHVKVHIDYNTIIVADLNTPLNNKHVTQTKINERSTKVKWHHEVNGHNRHL